MTFIIDLDAIYVPKNRNYSIVCENHRGTKAITLLEFHGENQGEYWKCNVCKECYDFYMKSAKLLSPNMIDATSAENIL